MDSSSYMYVSVLENKKKETMHILHLLLTLFTFFWFIPWICVTVSNNSHNKKIDKQIETFMVSTMPKQT